MSTLNAGTLNITGTLQLPSYTNSQRNALSASAGMMIYNSEEGGIEVYDGTEWKSAVGAGGGFITASGGAIQNDGDFRVHTFNSASAFVVTEVGDSTQPFGNTVDYLIVAGGGGGGGFGSGDFNNFGSGGGGGAGGVLRTDGYNYAVSAWFLFYRCWWWRNWWNW